MNSTYVIRDRFHYPKVSSKESVWGGEVNDYELR